MSDRPTFWEYIIYRYHDEVKTRSGRYYIFDLYTRKRRWFSIMLPVLFNALLFSSLLISPNVIFDVVIVNVLLFCLVFKLEYNSYHFKEFEMAQASTDPSVWRYRPALRKTGLCALALLMVFSLINSFSALAIKSAIENNPQIQIMEVRTDNDEVYTEIDIDGTTDTIILSQFGSEGTVYIQITTVRTPSRVSLCLDGKPLEYYHADFISWFWNTDYVSRFYTFFTDGLDIRDGSVLTLTCGDLVREWVFEVPDKEAS